MVSLKLRSLSGCALAAFAAAVLSSCATPADTSAVTTTVAAEPASAPAVPGRIEIKVLSSRYDLVSGGDALVEVKALEGARASDFRVSLNGRNLTTPLKYDQPSNTLRGVVTGLDNGANWLQVTGLGGKSLSQPLINYPAAGPVLSGPHIKPFDCKTKEAGLGEPLDENCSVATKYDWFYKSTAAPAAG